MTSKKETKIAKRTLRLSSTDGFIDVTKVRLILKELSAQKVTHLVRILKAYKRLLASSLSKEEVIVESAVKIANQKEFEDQIKTKTNAKRLIYKINPKIVAGVKITHGDWIWDDTLDSKLKQLTTDM